jgi:hypothetical protein
MWPPSFASNPPKVYVAVCTLPSPQRVLILVEARASRNLSTAGPASSKLIYDFHILGEEIAKEIPSF